MLKMNKNKINSAMKSKLPLLHGSSRTNKNKVNLDGELKNM